MKMKTYEKTGRAKKAGPTLTPDGKTLLRGTCSCAKSCGNQDDGRAFCRCSHHADEYREIAALDGELRTERLRQHLKSILTGPELSELRGFGFRLTANWPEAEELVQVACFKALRSAAIYDQRRALLGWLKAILRNAFYDETRHARLGVSLTLPVCGDGDFTLGDTLEGLDVPVEERLEREGGTAALLEAIADLPRPSRRAVTLCDLEGMTYEDAASRLGIAVGTVRSRVSRARQVLREKIGPLV
jgi:RNA polymerase sigma factor (sigma-70 family)